MPLTRQEADQARARFLAAQRTGFTIIGPGIEYVGTTP
jgi:hypothetical protein